jgi:hypothetical protein
MLADSELQKSSEWRENDSDSLISAKGHCLLGPFPRLLAPSFPCSVAPMFPWSLGPCSSII